MKNNLVLVPGYGNILAKIEKRVSDTCVYLRVLTGTIKGGLINTAKDCFIEIPDSENTVVI